MLVPLGDTAPDIHPGAWVAPNAVLAGEVRVEDRANVWYSAVVRADLGAITIGAGSNIQDGCVLHTDPGLQLVIGKGVTVGHRAVLHGCTIEADVLIGMGSIVMNGAVIGTGSIVGAGTLIPEGVVIPPNSLVMGVPGKVRRETTSDERLFIPVSADEYVKLAQRHAAAG